MTISRLAFIGIMFLALSSFATPCRSGESAWVYGSGESIASDTRTLADVQSEAHSKARRAVIEKAAGVKVQSETLVKNFILQQDFVASLSTGHIAEEEILKWDAEIIKKDERTPPIVLFRVHVRAKVAFEQGVMDPTFKIFSAINRSVFKHGDNIVIRIKSTRDCYINIFAITEDEKAFLIYPNKYQSNNFIKQETEFIFPSEVDISRGLSFQAGLLPGKNKTTERMKIIATKRPIKFTPTAFVEATSLDAYSLESASLLQLVKELLVIPAHERTEAVVMYDIVR